MIRRIAIAAESAGVLDGTVVLAAIAGALGAFLVAAAVLIVARAVRRRRSAAGDPRAEEPGYSAGVARVPSDRGEGGQRGRRVGARLFGLPSRNIGLDVARGATLALLAGVTVLQPFSGSDALATAIGLALVVISGVALAVRSGGPTPVEGVERLQFRMRVAVRAILLIGLGGVAAFSGGAFAGIVVTIGVLSLVGLAVAGWRSRWLFLAAVVWTVVVPIPAAALAAVLGTSGTVIAPPLQWALSGSSPPLPWVGALLAGMALGRLDPARIGQRWIVFAAAIGCAALALGMGVVLPARLGDRLPSAVVVALSLQPASAMPLMLLGFGAIALAFVTVCLLAGRALRWGLLLVSAAGSMALTLWVATLALIGAAWLLDPTMAREGPAALLSAATGSGPVVSLSAGLSDELRPVVVVAAAITLIGIVCAGWRLALGDGPVERLMRVIGAAATRVPGAGTPVEKETEKETENRVQNGAPSAFEALIEGAKQAPGGVAPETKPVRRPAIGPVDPVTAATQWTPGQALGRLPY